MPIYVLYQANVKTPRICQIWKTVNIWPRKIKALYSIFIVYKLDSYPMDGSILAGGNMHALSLQIDSQWLRISPPLNMASRDIACTE